MLKFLILQSAMTNKSSIALINILKNIKNSTSFAEKNSIPLQLLYWENNYKKNLKLTLDSI